MERVSLTLTVVFDGQFYAGIFESVKNGKLSAARYIFGAEPKDAEILNLINCGYRGIVFSPEVSAERKSEKTNFKAALRKAAKIMNKDFSLGTKSMQAMKLQTENRKAERRTAQKERKTAEKAEKFLLKELKKKEKRKGH